jgi:hypothetical protein
MTGVRKLPDSRIGGVRKRIADPFTTGQTVAGPLIFRGRCVLVGMLIDASWKVQPPTCDLAVWVARVGRSECRDTRRIQHQELSPDRLVSPTHEKQAVTAALANIPLDVNGAG